jgi:hypothetical protein
VESHGQSSRLHAEVLALDRILRKRFPACKKPRLAGRRQGTQAWHLTNAQAGRHPGQKLPHSSTSTSRGLSAAGAKGIPKKNQKKI